jgi:hypothetical protein
MDKEYIDAIKKSINNFVTYEEAKKIINSEQNISELEKNLRPYFSEDSSSRFYITIPNEIYKRDGCYSLNNPS